MIDILIKYRDELSSPRKSVRQPEPNREQDGRAKSRNIDWAKNFATNDLKEIAIDIKKEIERRENTPHKTLCPKCNNIFYEFPGDKKHIYCPHCKAKFEEVPDEK